MPEPVDTPLRLHAKDLADLTIIAAVVQDALVPIGDIAWLRDEGRFVMVINRFRWEAEGAVHGKEPPVHERVHAGLRFDNVRNVQYRAIDHRNRGSYLELLTIASDEDTVVLHFAGGGAIKLEIEELACVLRDLDEPWPTTWRPEHEEREQE